MLVCVLPNTWVFLHVSCGNKMSSLAIHILATQIVVKNRAHLILIECMIDASTGKVGWLA